jgi:hypothetical protein
MHTGGQMSFTDRLNAILPRITEDGFLEKKGLGNEIPFYVFDYPPEEELRMREHITFVLDRMSQQCGDVRILHLQLFDLMVQHLHARGDLEAMFALEVEQGSKIMWDEYAATLHPNRFINMLNDKYDLGNHDIIFISGVGSVWPWMRSHSLLENMQSISGNASVVLFYPGVYSGQSLKLFNRLEAKNYYRAVRLIL